MAESILRSFVRNVKTPEYIGIFILLVSPDLRIHTGTVCKNFLPLDVLRSVPSFNVMCSEELYGL